MPAVATANCLGHDLSRLKASRTTWATAATRVGAGRRASSGEARLADTFADQRMDSAN